MAAMCFVHMVSVRGWVLRSEGSGNHRDRAGDRRLLTDVSASLVRRTDVAFVLLHSTPYVVHCFHFFFLCPCAL